MGRPHEPEHGGAHPVRRPLHEVLTRRASKPLGDRPLPASNGRRCPRPADRRERPNLGGLDLCEPLATASSRRSDVGGDGAHSRSRRWLSCPPPGRTGRRCARGRPATRPSRLGHRGPPRDPRPDDPVAVDADPKHLQPGGPPATVRGRRRRREHLVHDDIRLGMATAAMPRTTPPRACGTRRRPGSSRRAQTGYRANPASSEALPGSTCQRQGSTTVRAASIAGSARSTTYQSSTRR